MPPVIRSEWWMDKSRLQYPCQPPTRAIRCGPIRIWQTNVCYWCWLKTTQAVASWTYSKPINHNSSQSITVAHKSRRAAGAKPRDQITRVERYRISDSNENRHRARNKRYHISNRDPWWGISREGMRKYYRQQMMWDATIVVTFVNETRCVCCTPAWQRSTPRSSTLI